MSMVMQLGAYIDTIKSEKYTYWYRFVFSGTKSMCPITMEDYFMDRSQVYQVYMYWKEVNHPYELDVKYSVLQIILRHS